MCLPSVYPSPAPLRSQVLSYVMANSEIQGCNPLHIDLVALIVFDIRKSLLQ